MAVEGRGRRSLWVLARGEGGDLMTFSDGGGGEALAVFGFEDEAKLFLRLGGVDGKWKAREAKVGDLMPLLRGPCATVGKVALDPVPAGINGSGPLDVAWASTEDFLGSFRAGG